VPKTGGTPKVLASSIGMARLAIDASSAYVSAAPAVAGTNDGSILRVPLGGGTTTTLASGLTTPEGIAVDGSSVYFVEANLGTVMKLSPK
jgi:hypothetical protein